MFINLTPHEINVYDGDILAVTIPPSGQVARVSERATKAGEVDGVTLYTTQRGDVAALPEPAANTLYIVSAQVRLALPERADLVSPGQLVRDANGQPIGCVGLVVNPTWKPANAMPQRIEFSDELEYAGIGGGSNRHIPFLWFWTGNEAIKFQGQSIRRVCRVVRKEYHKNGRWSYTDYVIDVAPGVEAWLGKGGLFGRLMRPDELPDGDRPGGMDRRSMTNWNTVEGWEEVKSPIALVRAAMPGTSARLDRNEGTI